ncbi:alpha/beta hydrolase family protein [Psychrobacillus antarcticus]|uniref:alpha/beta hydrolase family protein n=1 Tax=Psychrobacillus antarcticus TaxID=2879115 RepID=UPI002408030E|nr:alpha/beta hydrolase [Psychrobacillus antarcticus]
MRRFTIVFSSLAIIFILLAACSKEKEEASEMGSLEKIQGVWEGSINVPDQPLPIVVKFETDKGTISIPVQRVSDYPLTSVKLDESDLFFYMNIQGQKLTFDGKIEQEKIRGTFTQQGQTFPFELVKGNEEEVEKDSLIEVKVKDGAMSGQLEIPRGEGPFPLMVIIAGSGPTDRNGNSILLPGKNDSLKMLAEDLAVNGVATIRYDKRGVGQNDSLAGKEEDMRFDQYIEDAAGWVQFAKDDERFSKVGIIGHSEGSLIGMGASQKAEADVFISIAGAGRPIDLVLLEQLQAQLPANLMEESTNILEKLKQGVQVKTVSPELQSIFRSSVQPNMISWLQHNPVEQLQKLNGPVLIVNGNLDIQVSVKDAELLHQVKNDSGLLIVDKMNHVLKEAPANREGNIATYSNPELPLAEGLMDGIVEFMEAHVK